MGTLCSSPAREFEEDTRPRGKHRTLAGKARAEARKKNADEQYIQLEALTGEEEDPEETMDLLKKRSQWLAKQNFELKKSLQVATSRTTALEAEVLVKEEQLSLFGQPITTERGVTVEKFSAILKDFKYSLDYIDSIHAVLREELGDKAEQFIDAAKAPLIK